MESTQRQYLVTQPTPRAFRAFRHAVALITSERILCLEPAPRPCRKDHALRRLTVASSVYGFAHYQAWAPPLS